ncbi:MAG: DUF3800 domain-containing protein [Anaerolineales bacterium]
MKKTQPAVNWYFVDESGDPTFYDRHGNLIVGQAGCSPILILGFIETGDPHPMRAALADLHTRLAADEYLKDIPSMAKTNIAFHAKDDCAEARQAVFNTLHGLDFKAQFIVARKNERVFQSTFHGKEERFYHHLVSRLFQNVLHRHTENQVYFSKRGSSTRQEPLFSAIRTGVAEFEQKHQTQVQTQMSISAQTPVGEPCLQVIDYMNWAVYRAFVKQEMRYYRFVSEKVSLLVDLYDHQNYPHNWYSRERPFDINKISPL